MCKLHYVTIRCTVKQDLTNPVPVIRTSVSLPDRSVTCWKHKRENNSSIQRTTKVRHTIKSRKKKDFAYDEGIVEGGEDVSDAKDMLSLANSRTKRDIILLRLSYLLPPRLRTQIQVYSEVTIRKIWRKSDRDLRYLTMVAQLRFRARIEVSAARGRRRNRNPRQLKAPISWASFYIETTV